MRYLIILSMIFFLCGFKLKALKTVKVERKFTGTIDKKLKGKIPAGDFVSTEKAFKELWKDWGQKGKIPKVDFTKEMVIITTKNSADPNHVRHNIMLNEKGVLSCLGMSTLKGFRPANSLNFTFLIIKRDGIQSVLKGSYNPVTKKYEKQNIPVK